MNKFDQFVKHDLCIKHYARYTDDFVIVSNNQNELLQLLPKLKEFLREELKLELHPDKISVRSLHQGIDFLGYIIRPHHRALRTKTRRRIFRKFEKSGKDFSRGDSTKETFEQSRNSYLGVLSHGHEHQTEKDLKNRYWWCLGDR